MKKKTDPDTKIIFKREVISCLSTGCPNKTTRTVRQPGTTIVLCEFHLRKVMGYLQWAKTE
jgi:hypothetical protein